MNIDDWIIDEQQTAESAQRNIHHRTVKMTARLRNNETGEIRDYETDTYWEEDPGPGEKPGPNLFNWVENNYSCDCNRRIFFRRAAGEEESEREINLPCTQGKFSVQLINPKNGEVVHDEFDDWGTPEPQPTGDVFPAFGIGSAKTGEV